MSITFSVTTITLLYYIIDTIYIQRRLSMGDYILFNSKYKEISKPSKWKATFIILSLGLLTRLILLAAVSNPNLVENLYSTTIYPYIAIFLGFISNIIPFSIAEALLILISIFIVISLFYILLNPR